MGYDDALTLLFNKENNNRNGESLSGQNLVRGGGEGVGKVINPKYF